MPLKRASLAGYLNLGKKKQRGVFDEGLSSRVILNFAGGGIGFFLSIFDFFYPSEKNG